MTTYLQHREALAACLSSRRFALARLEDTADLPDMHLHDCYELYYSLDDGGHFIVQDCLYPRQKGDLYPVNPYEAHRASPGESARQGQLVLYIHPDYLRARSSAETDLTAPFLQHPEGFCHRLHLRLEEQQEFSRLLHRLGDIRGYGTDLLVEAAFVELMVWVASLYEYRRNQWPLSPIVGDEAWVWRVLAHIHQHLGESLSIEGLAETFMVSSGHLCRLFKRATGTTIARYITSCRIAQAKRLLIQGSSVQAAQQQAGFGDYSHFIRVFGQTVGLSPKQYALHYQQEEQGEFV